MTDFTSSFQKGQAAAINLERARAEIADSLDLLKKQLASATGGVLDVGIVQHPVEKKQTNSIMRVLDLQSLIPTEYQAYLSAKNAYVQGSSYRKLARWHSSPEGYPCTVTVGTEERVCFDQDSLNSVLADLLELGSVGEILRAVLAEGAKARLDGSQNGGGQDNASEV